MVLRVDYRVAGKQANRQKTYTKIIGGGGLMATIPFLLPTGTKVEMNLYHDSFVIPFEAQVVWADLVKNPESSEYQCGFRYITDSENGLMHIQNLVQTQQHV